MEVGDVVSWWSQASGHTREKKGTVVAIIPAGKTLREAALDIIKTGRSMAGATGTRKEQSYLVAVPTKSGRGKPKLYWPIAKSLVLVASPTAKTMPMPSSDDVTQAELPDLIPVSETPDLPLVSAEGDASK